MGRFPETLKIPAITIPIASPTTPVDKRFIDQLLLVLPDVLLHENCLLGKIIISRYCSDVVAVVVAVVVAAFGIDNCTAPVCALPHDAPAALHTTMELTPAAGVLQPPTAQMHA
jgi:hypothetical protein